MSEDKKIIGPFEQVLTMADMPMRGAISNDALGIRMKAGVVCEGGKITAIDHFETLVKDVKNDQVQRIEKKMVLIPGLIDAHTHICFGGSRHLDYSARNEGISYLEIARRGGGIWDTVQKTRLAEKSILLDGAKKRVQRCIDSGITTLEVKSGYGLNVEEELRMLDVIAQLESEKSIDIIATCLAAHIKPKDFDGDNVDYLHYLTEELLPVVKSSNLSNRIDIFVEEDAFTVEQSRAYIKAAKEMGFQICIHGDQFSPGGSALAVEMRALSVDHLEASGEDEIRMLGQSSTVSTVLPGASLGLGIGFAPARRLLDQGAILAIASDWNPGSAPMGDLLTQAALLGAYEKLTDAEVLAGMNYRAASALGFSDRGKLIAGMQADMCAFEASDYREILYYQGQLKPSHVWKNGIQIK